MSDDDSDSDSDSYSLGDIETESAFGVSHYFQEYYDQNPEPDAQKVINACYVGDMALLKEVLERNPTVKIKHAGEVLTPAHFAIMSNSEEAINVLMKIPDTEINTPSSILGETPFYFACISGNTNIVKAFFMSPRFNTLNTPNRNMETPLVGAVRQGVPEVVELMIALSYEELDMGESHPRSNPFDMSAMAFGDYAGCISLLERFKKDNAQVRFELREKLGFLGINVPYYFILVVMYCDGYLSISDTSPPEAQEELDQKRKQAKRFFSIVGRLPIELQMLACNRVAGSSKDIIQTDVFNRAFEIFLKAS